MKIKMKKVTLVCLATLMVLCMGITAFAAPGSFVSSPSGNPAPTLISFTPGDSSCSAELIITAYINRDTLSEKEKTLIEQAYSVIATTDDLTTLNSDLLKLVNDKKLNGKKLAVSDLFDARIEGCTVHEGHVGNEVVLESDTLNRFVALLRMKDDGEWELVSNAEIINDGKQLRFTSDTFCPYAIVVNTEIDNPKTGDATLTYVCAVVMALCAVSLAFIAVKSRKKKA